MTPRPCNVVPVEDARAVGLAAEALLHGRLVGLPTETVYGLAGDALSEPAVSRIFAVKGRPTTHPLILHLASVDWLASWADSLNGPAELLARECWPGPLTLLLDAGPDVPRAPIGGGGTAAFRVPAHPTALAVIDAVGRPVAAPSANRFGRVSPTMAGHVCEDLGGDVDLVIDGGPSVLGIESTIVDATGPYLQILRHGAIPKEDLESIVACTISEARGAVRAPGMLPSHYAPACRVLLAADAEEVVELGAECDRRGETWRALPAPHSLPVYAATLYEELRRCDRLGLDAVVAILPPARGLGCAIRDRLMKAAAPR